MHFSDASNGDLGDPRILSEMEDRTRDRRIVVED